MFSKVMRYKSATQKEQNILNHDYPQYLFFQHRGTEKQRCTMESSSAKLCNSVNSVWIILNICFFNTEVQRNRGAQWKAPL